jgi:chromosome partitioning protein
MSKIITVSHQKGGVGKSTLALNLAYSFGQHMSVAIVDLDPQGSIARIKSLVTDMDIHQVTKISEIKHLEFDFIIVDTPPYIANNLPELFGISDYIIVPTKAGFPDIMAIKDTIKLIHEAIKLRPQIKAGIVLNMMKSRSALNSVARNQLETYDLPILASIKDRVSYGKSFITGGVLQTDDQQAIEELNELTKQILTL